MTGIAFEIEGVEWIMNRYFPIYVFLSAGSQL